MLQFIGLANYFRDHVPNMTEMVKPLRDMIPLGKYQRTGKLIWTTEGSAAFKLCQQAMSDCQELYFLDDTATPILQTDASDFGIGGYLKMVTNGKVRVVQFFSKALTGAQLNWSTREKECYGKTFEDMLDNRHFILKTDNMNLTYLNVTLTGKVQRWKLYLHDKDFHLCHVPRKEVHQFVPDALSRLCDNHMPAKESEKPPHSRHQAFLASIEPKHRIPDTAFKQIANVHNSMVGHWGLQKCRERLNDTTIIDRTITQRIRQCTCCQVMSRQKILIKTHPLTCAFYNPFESLHIEHIGPLPVDDKGNTHILVIIELFPTKTTGAS